MDTVAFKSSIVAPGGTATIRPGTLVSLASWLNQIGVTTCTAWRWRKKGWLKVINICGRLYLSEEAIHEFNERARKGEFAQEHKVPRRKEDA